MIPFPYADVQLWNSSRQPAYVEKELDLTLKQLGLDYVDLYRALLPRHLLMMF